MPTALDEVARSGLPSLVGKRVAVVANHTAVDRHGRHLVEILQQQGVEVVRILGPEHGLWGVAQDMEAVADSARDPVFNIPVRSLYGDALESLNPDDAALEGIDAVVADIQDLGIRYYTYAATIAFVMRAAAQRALPFWVLDRPNPIGPRVEGPLLRPGYESFCGIVPGLPIRHGLSLGELSVFYMEAWGLSLDLHIVEANKDAQLPFLPPSPNMPTRLTAEVYAGMCLFEGTTLSEGRGTTAPFLQIGAPGLDAQRLAGWMRERGFDGLSFVPVRFRPAFQKHAGEVCDGLYLWVEDASAFSSVAVAAHLLAALKALHPELWSWRTDAYEFVKDKPAIDLLWGSPALRRCIDEGGDLEALLGEAEAEAQGFRWTRLD